MKKIEYNVESTKNIADKNIAICSGFHINQETNHRKIDAALAHLDKICPTHIVIPGDLYEPDNLGHINSRVNYFINSASDIAEIFYIRGSLEETSPITPYQLYYSHNPRVHLLCEDKIDGKENYALSGDIAFAGIKLPLEFYALDETAQKDYVKLKYSNLMLKYSNYLNEVFRSSGSDRFKILLCYNPIIAELIPFYQDVFLTNDSHVDLIISGHNHGGSKEIVKYFNSSNKLSLIEPSHEKTIENVKIRQRKLN